MSVFYDLNKTPRNILNQAIVKAIVAESNGAMFDPSDLTTMFQDAAGTIPVTAVEQPVGKMLDKSGNGYHATQSITASRPTLSARKNILLATETLATQSVTTLAAQYTLSFTGTGSVTLSGTATGTLTGTGTDRVSLTFTPTAGTLTLTVSGSVTKAQIELGSIAGPYQRVTTATDYDTDERYFKKFVRFDGVDDYLNLPYMGLYAGGAATSIMARDMIINPKQMNFIIEASTASTSPIYYQDFQLLNTLSEGVYIQNDAGTAVVLSAPNIGEVVTGAMIKTMVVGSSSVKKYRNGVPVGNISYTRSGTLTLNTTTLGATSGPTVISFAKMNLYGLLITKSALTDAQRIACERHLSRKAGVIL